MTTIAEALDMLVRPDKTVAEVLTEAGCRGRHGSMICPVAVFLQKATGRNNVHAGVARAYVWVTGLDWLDATMPDAVSDFISEFDKGHHPELEVSDV